MKAPGGQFSTPLVEVRGITKKFPGVTALDNVSFSLQGGEVHALLGENGSGKSTLIKILCGLYSPDDGEVFFQGTKINWKDPAEAQKRGIATIHQEINLIPNMDVASNMFLNWEPVKGSGLIIDNKRMYARAKEVLDKTGIALDPRAKVSRLSAAEKQLVEIAKAMVGEMKVLVLDEPTAALPAHEVERLFEIIIRLKEQGIGVIYVSHRLEEIERLADRVTVIRDGKLVATRTMEELTIDEIIRLMVGRDVHRHDRVKTTTEIGEIVYRVKNLSFRHIFRHVDLELKKGEILGIAGLVGSGRSELAAALGGALPEAKGQFYLGGAEVKIPSPAAALKLGIGFLPSERKAEGLATLLSVKDNILMASFRLFSNWCGVLFGTKLNRTVNNFVSKLEIKIASIHQKVGNLSGGNQQKVVLAKVLARGSKILVFDEPTRGIDVGTRREIYHLMNELTADGSSIIISSSDLPELMQTCDRILVMYKGKTVVEFDSGVPKEDLLRAVLGKWRQNTEEREEKGSREETGPSPRDLPAGRRKNLGSVLSQTIGVPFFILVLILFFGFNSENFLSTTNLYNLSIQLSILVFLASAEAFAIITQGVDMSVGSTMALVGMVVGVVGVASNMYLGIFAGMIAALCLGLMNGFFIGKMRMDPFIVTLGCMYIARGTALLSQDGQPVYGFPEWFSFLSDGTIGPVPFLLIFALLFGLVCQMIIARTRLGRHLAAIGGNSEGARVSGVKVGLRKGSGYVISALLAGLAGIIFTARLFSSQPTLGSSAHLEAITAAIIGGISLEGGRGDIIGVISGVLVIGILSNGMNIINVSPYTQLVIMGAVLIISLVIDRMRVLSQEKLRV